MKKLKKRVLILGGSSDIGMEVVKFFLKLNWSVEAHFSKNKKKLEILQKRQKNLKIIKYDFAAYKNKNFERLLKKKFDGNFDSFINLIGYTDNKSFESTNFQDIFKNIEYKYNSSYFDTKNYY